MMFQSPSPYPCPMDVAARVVNTDAALAYRLVELSLQRRLLGVHTLKFNFTTGNADKPLQGTFPTTLGEDFFVVDIRSTVRRPLYAAGSIYKAQSDYFNALSSGVDLVKTEVVGGTPGRKYVINDDQCALELIAPNANGQGRSVVCGMDAVLDYSQTVKAMAVLTRELAADELPMEVQIAFLGWSLGCQGYFKMPRHEALGALKGLRDKGHLSTEMGLALDKAA